MINKTITNNPFLDEFEASSKALQKKYSLQIISSNYSDLHFGNASVEFLMGTLRFRVFREKGCIEIHIANSKWPYVWIPLYYALKIVAGSKSNFPEIENFADLSEVSNFFEREYEKTLIKLNDYSRVTLWLRSWIIGRKELTE